MTTIHVATSFENRTVARRVMRLLEAGDFAVARDWTVFENHQHLDSDRLRQQAMARADAVVVLLPAGRSTHVELGMAIGMGKPVLLFAGSEAVLHNHADNRVCSYYAHSGVLKLISMEEAEIVTRLRWWFAQRGDNR
jgi:nucleoside 2-deoxyribosyltransferase